MFHHSISRLPQNDPTQKKISVIIICVLPPLSVKTCRIRIRCRVACRAQTEGTDGNLYAQRRFGAGDFCSDALAPGEGRCKQQCGHTEHNDLRADSGWIAVDDQASVGGGESDAA